MYCIYPVVNDRQISSIFNILMVQNYLSAICPKIHNVFVDSRIYEQQSTKEYTVGCWRIKEGTLKIK